MKGVRRVQARKPPKLRPGLDDPTHLARVRLLTCSLRGKRGVIKKWIGRYPDVELVEIEVQHICEGRIEAHHTTRKAQRGHDRTAAPLCTAGHALVHQQGTAWVETTFDVDLAGEAERVGQRAG